MNLLFQYIILFVLFLIMLKRSRPGKNAALTALPESDSVMRLVQFMFMTALIYLAAISETKYFLYVSIGLLVILHKRLAFALQAPTFFYLCIFMLWAIWGTVMSPSPVSGFLMLIKYGVLLLCIILGFGVNASDQSIIRMFHNVMIAMLIYSLLGGGIAWVCYPGVYILIWNFILTYAGMADCFSAIIPIGLFLFFITRKPWYLVLCLLLFLSSVLEVVRTGIGGISIAIACYLVLRYRVKSFVLLSLFTILISGVILYVPIVRDKMFHPDIIQQLEDKGLGWYLFDHQSINDNGRESLKIFVHDTLDKNDEHFWTGAGTGACRSVLKIAYQNHDSKIILLHNDHYVTLLDNGAIGVGLWILWILAFMVQVITYARSPAAREFTKNLGYCALSSLLAMNFAMFFDNVISHSLSSIGLSCLLIGMFLRQTMKEKKENTVVSS